MAITDLLGALLNWRLSGRSRLHAGLVLLEASGSLLGVSDGVFLKVGALEPLGNLAAKVCHTLGFSRFGFHGPNPLKLTKKFFHLGSVALRIAECHLHRRFAVAGPVLDLRRVGNRF
jgi:hypothetical protein